MKRALALPLVLVASAHADRIADPPPQAAKPAPTTTVTTLELPGGNGGIGFDDLRFSVDLQRVLAPAGRTGKLDLIDPKTQAIESVDGFSSDAKFGGGHGEGTTSVDAGGGLLFASDRGKTQVAVIDPSTKKVLSWAKLAGSPDYVRWVAATNEVWVTEPGKKQIEFFSLGKNKKLTKKGALVVKGGPESLVIDTTRSRAYTHTWQDATVVIDLAKHKELARWKNGCSDSRGIALDEAAGLLFVGCEEGKATSLDVAHEGKQLGTANTGKGVDIIAYDAKLAHLYVPSESGSLAIIGVDKNGALSSLDSVRVAEDSHCATSDGAGHVYVCDPKNGALLIVTDRFGASR